MLGDAPYVINLKGGLGNQLFQLAASYGIANQMKSNLHILNRFPSKHTSIQYFDTIFREWKPQVIADAPRGAVVLDSYFQDHRLIEPAYNDFVSSLDFTGFDKMLDELHTSAFIHVRGGDYLQPGFRELHHVDMTNYYKRAAKKVSGHAYAFTNDKAYYESLTCFDDLRLTPVETNEIHTLFLMSECARGGIAPNSTLSWWGLYLDRRRPNLILPDKWFNDPCKNINGYFFPEASILPTD